MADPTEPSGSPEDDGFLDDLDDLDAYDAEHEQPGFQQRLADASTAVVVGAVALIALIAGVIGFGIGTQVGGNDAKTAPVNGSSGGGGAPTKPIPARVLGPVVAVNGRFVTVTDVGGAHVKVGVGPKDAIMTTTRATPTAVKVGSRIMVITSRPMQASRVIVAPAGAKTGAPVTAVKAGSITVAGLAGKPIVFSTVGADFLTAKPGTLADVTAGERVVVFGLRGKGGVAAQTLVVIPKPAGA
ncbi:MAG: hypothetical protein ACKOOG_09120 [Actinomycetota bacterium]